MSRLIKFESSTFQQVDTKVIRVKNLQSDNNDAEQMVTDSKGQDIINQAEEEAQFILQQARAQVEQLHVQLENERSKWEEEKITLVNEAHEEGMKLGIEEGRNLGFAEYNALIEQAQQIVQQSKMAFMEHVESSEKTILELAIHSAEKIIQVSLAEDEQKFLPLVKHVLKETRQFKEVQIHVHPSQFEFLLSEKKELDAIFPHNIQCFIYPNADLTDYACMIESENGRIDASISSQLVELKGKLMELLEGESE